jgi:2'-5' RNA ligase
MSAPKYFIAVVPEGLKDNSDLKVLLGKMKRTLKDKEKAVRWMPPDMWHITLQFLGAMSEQELTLVYAALNSWKPQIDKLELKVQGVGAFPDPQDARVLWLGVQNSQELQRLQVGLRAHLRTHNVDTVEDRPFLPHLTLARLRNLQSVADLVGLGGRKSFGEYKVAEVILFQSVLQQSMSKYIPLSRKRISDSGLVPPK